MTSRLLTPNRTRALPTPEMFVNRQEKSPRWLQSKIRSTFYSRNTLHPQGPMRAGLVTLHVAGGRVLEGPPGPPSLPRLGRGAPGEGGSAGVGARRGGAGPRPEMSSVPPGVARRLHQTPLRAPTRATSRQGPSGPACRFGQGRVSSGRAAAYASGGLHRGLLPRPLRARTRGLLTCASGRPARPQAASTPSGPARRGPTRPRPRSPRDGKEERRLRNRQPPPVPPPRPPPAFPLLGGSARCRAAVTNRSAGLRATRSPRETGSASSQSQAV